MEACSPPDLVACRSRAASEERLTLEPELASTIVRLHDLTHETLEGQLFDQKVCRLLVLRLDDVSSDDFF